MRLRGVADEWKMKQLMEVWKGNQSRVIVTMEPEFVQPSLDILPGENTPARV